MRWNRFQTVGILLCLLMLSAGSAWSECGCGLVFRSEQGFPIDAPALGTTVEVRVTGIVARAKVTQIFTNPSQEWLTGVYLFPLPQGAAVDTLRLTVGDRKMEGVIQTKEKARETLQTAEQEGRKASLLEEVRPGLYSTSVANVGPGETVEVEIEMQQVVAWEQGRFVLRFPMLAPPRYTPPVRKKTADEEDIPNPPVSVKKINPFAFHVDLSPGFPLGAVTSSTHKIKVEQDRKRLRWAVDLAKGVAPADGDFILEWAPAVGREPRAVYFTEEVDGEQYSLLMMMPPDDGASVADRLPRETVFVIDTSGSMSGLALEQAKQALLQGIARLQPGDWFNVMRFSSQASALFTTSVPVRPDTLAAARTYVEALQVDGGTEMLPALRLALNGGRPGLVQQVIFATDGQVGNEAEILRELPRLLGNHRLFTVAIGSAPNAAFLRRAAETGRGSLTQISSLNEVAAGMAELFSRLESPMLRDIDILWSDPAAEAWPSRVPDLYLGEPLVVSARSGETGSVSVSGLRNGSSWQDELPTPAVVKSAGLDKLWAGRKIQTLMDSLHDPGNPADADAVRREVTELGLRHHLVTNWTSLVAVDVEVTAQAGIQPQRALVPVNAPRGSGSGFAELITVTGESPLVDVRRISTGSTVSQTELEKIPSARDPWAVLQATPGILTDRVNVGGNESGQQSVAVLAGASQGQNSFVVDGVVLTDMAAMKAAPSYFDFDAFEEMQVDTGGVDVSSNEDGPGAPFVDNSFGISEVSRGIPLALLGLREASHKEKSMRSTPLVTAAVLALSLSAAAWGDDRWGNPHGDQDYRYNDRYNRGRVDELAREVARTADAIHREYERNNRRPNRDEARVAVALHRLEEAAVRFYDRVDDRGRDSRRGSRDFEILLRAFDDTADTLRYINRRPYVDRGMDRIWSLLTQMDRYYGVSGRYGRGYGHDRYDRHDDRYGRDRYDRHDRDDRYRPPHKD